MAPIPIISIIIPNFNSAGWLSKCLDSCFQQEGVLDLIRVFNAVKKSLPSINIELDIVGDGEDMDAALALVEKLSLSGCVQFYGKLSHQELIAHVKAADICVLNSRISPSGDSEGLPNSILEAMAAGTAVVSTYHAGIPEVVFHEETGLLVDEYDNEGLKLALIRLVQSKDFRCFLTRRAKKNVSKEFTLNTMCYRLKNLLTFIANTH